MPFDELEDIPTGKVAPTPSAPIVLDPSADEDAPSSAADDATADTSKSTATGVEPDLLALADSPAPESGLPAFPSAPTVPASDAEPGGVSETGTAEQSGNRKAPSLPRPGRLGAKSSGDFRDAPREPSASSSSGATSLPRGIKPPPSASAVPSELESEDTDVLIASVADAIASESEKAAAESTQAHAAASASLPGAVAAASFPGAPGASTPAGSAVGSEVPSMAVSAASAPGAWEERPAWLPWAAVGGVVAVVLFAFIAWPSDDDPPEAEAPVAHNEGEPAAEVEPPGKEQPAGEAPAVASPSEEDPAGEPEAVPEEDPALAELVAEGATDGQPELDTAAGEETVEVVEDPADAGGEPEDGKGKKKKKRGSKAKAKPSPSPAPKPKAKPKQSDDSASSLLQKAKAELSKGRAPEAYRLANSSYRKAKSTSALQVMAKAACRMGNKAKAKSAFDRLSVSQRGGIRAECRKRGVKLGI